MAQLNRPERVRPAAVAAATATRANRDPGKAYVARSGRALRVVKGADGQSSTVVDIWTG